MMVPPIAGVGGEWSIAHIASLGRGEPTAGASAALGAPVGAPEAQAPGAAGPGSVEGASGGFGATLTDAVSALEQTQRSGDSAAQALATGTVSDPESAVVTVEDAQLAMQLAGQIRGKVTEAAQEIFQTQV